MPLPERLDTHTDPLSELLLPRLLASLDSATQRMEQLRLDLARHADNRDTLEAIDELGLELEILGWVLAVLASGAGMHLVLDRREVHGTEYVIELLADALAEHGTELRSPQPPLKLSPRAPDGWRLPWVLASLLLAAARGGTPKLEWSWEIRGSSATLRFTVDSEVALESLWVDRLQAVLAGARFEQRRADCTLAVPADWLHP